MVSAQEKELINSFKNALQDVQKKRSDARVSSLVKTASKFERKLYKRAQDKAEIKNFLADKYNIDQIDDETMMKLNQLVDEIDETLGGQTEPAAPPTDFDPSIGEEMEMPEIPRPPRVPTFSSVVKKFETILKNAK